jgi:hypothetical protein
MEPRQNQQINCIVRWRWGSASFVVYSGRNADGKEAGGWLPSMCEIDAIRPAIRSVAARVELIQREAREERPGWVLVLARLIEVSLVEALRAAPGDSSGCG